MCCLTCSHPHTHNVCLSGGTLRSLGAPLDRFTMREVEKGGGEGWRVAKRGCMQVLEYSLCAVFVCVILNTNAHICTFKLIKTKQNKMKTKAVLQLQTFSHCFLSIVNFRCSVWESSHTER